MSAFGTHGIVMFLISAGMLTAQTAEVVRGRIIEVREASRQVVVQSGDDKQKVFHVPEKATLEYEGKAVKLGDFRKDMDVRVAFETRAGRNEVVSMTTNTVTGQDIENEIRDALRAVKTYTFEQRGEYRERLRRVADRAEDRIKVLQDQASRAGAEAQKKYAKQIEELRQARDRAMAQADRARSATAEAWEELKTGTGKALEELRDAFRRAVDRVR